MVLTELFLYSKDTHHAQRIDFGRSNDIINPDTLIVTMNPLSADTTARKWFTVTTDKPAVVSTMATADRLGFV